MVMIFGAIEAGGTKFICCIGRQNEEPLAIERIPTTTPDETFRRAIAFFERAQATHGRCAAFGIASFGPLDLEAGRITETPKPGWNGTDLVAPIREAFQVPVAIDTDVNGAGLAEAIFGAGRDARSLVYITVGTGIGGSAILDRKPLHGASHPEMGHIRVPRHRDDTSFAGVCPFHGDCVEGLASGPAVERRWGRPAEHLTDPAVWDILGFYVAQLCVTVTMLIAPNVIVIGGGLAQGTPLLAEARRWTHRLLAGYPNTPVLSRSLDPYIVPPALGVRAGIIGALVLARQELIAASA